MNHRIPRDSWSIIEKIIRRFPETKVKYEEMKEKYTEGSTYNDGLPKGNLLGNPTESTVFLLNSSLMERMEREIDAVEKVYNTLIPDYQKIIRVRFWSDRSKNMPYIWMEKCVSYKEAQLRRVAGRFVKNVGIELGEI